MTDFPDWTGPEAVRRLNAASSSNGFRGRWQWPENNRNVEVQALQQLMVDAGLPEPVDEVEALVTAVWEADRQGAVALIREALAKARGERT